MNPRMASHFMSRWDYLRSLNWGLILALCLSLPLLGGVFVLAARALVSEPEKLRTAIESQSWPVVLGRIKAATDHHCDFNNKHWECRYTYHVHFAVAGKAIDGEFSDLDDCSWGENPGFHSSQNGDICNPRLLRVNPARPAQFAFWEKDAHPYRDAAGSVLACLFGCFIPVLFMRIVLDKLSDEFHGRR